LGAYLIRDPKLLIAEQLSGILFLARPNHDAFWTLFVAAFCVSPLVGVTMAYEALKPMHIRTVDSARGVLKLRFRNQSYQRILAERQVSE
jgi:hypothetical protein